MVERQLHDETMTSLLLNRLVLIVLVFLAFHASQQVMAQVNDADSTGIIEKMVARKDTLVSYAAPLDFPRRPILERPIDSVLMYGKYSSRFRKELYNLLIRQGTRDTVKKWTPINNSGMAAMDGKIIRHIDFAKVDIFAPAVTDTGYVPRDWLERTTNSLHRDTRNNILKRHLLVKPGDPLDVFLTSENERLFRNLSFIMDARFLAIPVKGTDSVDLLLLTQDMLPLGLEAEMTKATLAVLGLSNHNVLGFGHQLEATTYWDMENKPHVGYRLSYGTSNLAGTFASGELEYVHKWNQESYSVSFLRDFRSTSFKNAGGFLFENTELTRNIVLLDTTLMNVNLDYSITDFWVGRLLPLKSSSKWIKSGFFLTARINKYENQDDPLSDNEFLYLYQDRTLMLFSTGISREGFRKDKMIYTFGRIEDVPFGYQFQITAGHEWGQVKDRPYLGIGAAFGNYFKNSTAYWSARIVLGSFVNKGLMEQGAFRLQANYISPLYHPNRFQFRHLISYLYVHGINRYRGEFVSVENRSGVTGLSSPLMRWNDKLVLNLETQIFSPYKLLGFRFAFFGRFDLGVVTAEKLSMDETRLFMGISTGVRMRNEQLVFDNIVIRVGIFPGMPHDATASYFNIDYLARSRFQDFLPSKPALAEYR
ncbi:MAG: hypothetical protein JXA72_11185 [Bacteroidales bacterium]|nr:hypothetical protein [Bacteroidales bacterium]